ncbi:MAG: hypothetical protein DYH20_11770 [Gammaproteobacteria bacterium PRO9]|nr:hypothetical protein [Gammaproteobacteria bacterium PRO9]
MGFDLKNVVLHRRLRHAGHDDAIEAAAEVFAEYPALRVHDHHAGGAQVIEHGGFFVAATAENPQHATGKLFDHRPAE